MAGKLTIHPRGTPLPDGHPLKGGCVIFGWNRPPSSEKPSTPEKETSNITSLPTDNEFDIVAHRSLEASMLKLLNPPMEILKKDPSQSSDTDTESPSEAPSPENSTVKE